MPAAVATLAQRRCLIGASVASLAMAVPVHPSLVGILLYQQGVSLDPGFNPAGLTVSNAVRVTIGSL